MDIFVGVLIGFMIGFTLCGTILYFHVNRIMEIMNSIERKYQTIVTVISKWQHDLANKI